MKAPLLVMAALAAGLALVSCSGDSGAPAGSPAENTGGPKVEVRLLDAKGQMTTRTNIAKVVKTDADWRKQLSEKEYYVMREKGTEAAYLGALDKEMRAGVYYCAGCGLPLFTSETKYHSGSGWPSFFASLAAENVATQSDSSAGMSRTEIMCARCGAHLGHVFEDGPKPTGLRYCVNSVSLNFKKDGRFKASPTDVKP